MGYIHCFKCGKNAFLCYCTWPAGKEPDYVKEIRRRLSSTLKHFIGKKRTKMLQFTYTTEDGAKKEMALEFRRSHRNVTTYRKGGAETVKSKYPYTTVNLVELQPVKSRSTIVASATVGCFKDDTYSVEEGRRAALRKLTPKIKEQLRPLVWDTYLGRFFVKVEEKSEYTGSEIPLFTPEENVAG